MARPLTNNLVAIVALGSNLGDSRRIISDAMTRLEQFSAGPIIRSSLWQTSPVDCPPGSLAFVNATVCLTPLDDETPESLLKKLRILEQEFGRTPKTVRNESRALDLDLIVFGDESRNSSELVLPHPRAHLRRFVLQPMCEVAPDLILGGQGKTVATLLAALPARERVTQL